MSIGVIQVVQVMKEVGRVLKPGGMVILSTSNRCFPTKAGARNDTGLEVERW